MFGLFKKDKWWEKLPSNMRLTPAEKRLLAEFKSEEDFVNNIPYEILVNSPKLYLKNTVEMYVQYLATGTWEYIPYDYPRNPKEFIRK